MRRRRNYGIENHVYKIIDRYDHSQIDTSEMVNQSVLKQRGIKKTIENVGGNIT